MGDFYVPDVNWEYHTAVTSRFRKFLKYVENFFFGEATKRASWKGFVLDLLFGNREGFLG